MTTPTSINVTIEKIPGGYVIHTQDGSVIETSLNKAMSLTKSILTKDVAVDLSELVQAE